MHGTTVAGAELAAKSRIWENSPSASDAPVAALRGIAAMQHYVRIRVGRAALPQPPLIG